METISMKKGSSSFKYFTAVLIFFWGVKTFGVKSVWKIYNKIDLESNPYHAAEIFDKLAWPLWLSTDPTSVEAVCMLPYRNVDSMTWNIPHNIYCAEHDFWHNIQSLKNKE